MLAARNAGFGRRLFVAYLTVYALFALSNLAEMKLRTALTALGVTVGIGCLLEYYRANVSESPYEMQQAFVGRLRERRIVEGQSSRGDFTPCHVPIAGPIRQTAWGRVLVAGDAGGFVIPRRPMRVAQTGGVVMVGCARTGRST